MLLPISFLVQNIKTTEEARFFLALRATCLNRSGYFDMKLVKGFNYRQKLNLTKKLTDKGYINNGHLISVYRLATHPVLVKITSEDLSTKQKFKGFIIAATESYIARKQQREKRIKEKAQYCKRDKCSQRRKHVKEKSKQTSNEYIKTQIAISYLSKFLGISDATVKRYRKLTQTNTYKFERIYSKGQIWEDEKCIFWAKKQIWVHFKLEITCRVQTSFNKRFYSKKLFAIDSLNLSV
jgi:hypothetical protein